MKCHRFYLISAAILVLSLLAGCAAVGELPPDPVETVSATETPPPAETVFPAPEASSPEPLETAPEPSEAAPEPSEASPEPTSTLPPVEPYYFGMPAEEGEPVEESWLEDAVFLGDSRTEGLQLFSGLRTGDFYWSKGMNVFKAADPEKRVLTVDGVELSMLEALALKEYGKVYIMIGINELGYSVSSYEEGLRNLLTQVKAIQPNAVIYLQTLPPVNETVAKEKGLGSYVKNTKVNAFNEVIYRLAWEMETVLLDVAEPFRTEEGELAADMAVDGVHFYRKGYTLWREYLLCHTVDPAACAVGEPLPEAIVPEVPDPPVVDWTEKEPQPTETVTPEPVPSESPEVTEPDPSREPENAQPLPSEEQPVTSEPLPEESQQPPVETAPPAPSDSPAAQPVEPEAPAAGSDPAQP